VIAGTTTVLPVAADVCVGGVRGTMDMTQHWVILTGVPLGTDNPPDAWLTATAPGYVTVTQSVTLNSASYTTVSVEMSTADPTQTATVQGAVTDSATQAPLDNALVTFTPDFGSVVTGYTDKAGHYDIGGISVGTGQAMAQAAGYLQGTQAVNLTPDSSGTNAAVNLALLGGNTKVTVTGQILLVGLETPLAGVQVTIGDVGPVTSDTNGNFTLPGVSVGTQTVMATLTSYDDKTESVEVLPAMAPLVLYMSPTSPGPPAGPYTITGQVTSQTGAPIVGATVAAVDEISGATEDAESTDANGNYYLFVPPGSYQITATYQTHSIHTDVTLLGGGRIMSGVNFTLFVSSGVTAAMARLTNRTVRR